MKKLIFLTLLVLTFFVNSLFSQIIPAAKFSNANFYGGIWVRDSILGYKLKVDTAWFTKGLYIGNTNVMVDVPTQGLAMNGNIYAGDWWSSVKTFYPKTPAIFAYGTVNDTAATMIVANDYGHNFGSKLTLYNYTSGEYMINNGSLGMLSFSGNYFINELNSIAIDGAKIECKSEGDWLMGGNISASLTFSAKNANVFNEGVRINSNGSVKISGAYTFPTSDGTMGYGLGTNGVGVLGWYRYLTHADSVTYLTKSMASKTYQQKGTYYTPSDTTSTLLTKSKANKLYGDDYANIAVLSTQINPLDATTYYIGGCPMVAATTGNTYTRVYIQKAGVITGAEYSFVATNAVGTNENITAYIRLNNTVDYEIATVGVATAQRMFSRSNFNISVNAGDYIEIKVVCPVWATNPSSVVTGGYITVKY